MENLLQLLGVYLMLLVVSGQQQNVPQQQQQQQQFQGQQQVQGQGQQQQFQGQGQQQQFQGQQQQQNHIVAAAPAGNPPQPVQMHQNQGHVHAPAYSAQGAYNDDAHLHEAVQPQGGGAQQIQPQLIHGNSRLHNRDMAHDRDHVMEHLDGTVNQPNTNKMSDDEVQFHYFKLHDYNNDNRLDGIELISALTHFHKDGKHARRVLPNSELGNLVDGILYDDDRNYDGYIDYTEFILSQRR